MKLASQFSPSFRQFSWRHVKLASQFSPSFRQFYWRHVQVMGHHFRQSSEQVMGLHLRGHHFLPFPPRTCATYWVTISAHFRPGLVQLIGSPFPPRSPFTPKKVSNFMNVWAIIYLNKDRVNWNYLRKHQQLRIKYPLLKKWWSLHWLPFSPLRMHSSDLRCLALWSCEYLWWHILHFASRLRSGFL